MPRPMGVFGIARSVRLSVCLSHGAAVCLGYRHAGCLQLSQRRPPEMCRLRTRPRTDVDSPRFLDPRWPDWRRNVELSSAGAYRLATPEAIPSASLTFACRDLCFVRERRILYRRQSLPYAGVVARCFAFLPRDAMLRGICYDRVCVCLSVCVCYKSEFYEITSVLSNGTNIYDLE